MKRLIFIFGIFAFTIFGGKSQPNGGFENWSTVSTFQEPDNWQTLNFLSFATSNPLSAFKASGIDKHSGNYALKLKTVSFNSNPFSGQIGDSSGTIFTGKITTSPLAFKYGFAYTGRPEKLEFWSKYIPVGDDTAGVAVVLTKWNGINDDTIAVCLVSISPSQGYIPNQLNLFYFSTEQPDSAVIGFASSRSPLTARLNSTLYIDDVEFTGWVGINKNTKNDNHVKIFPNPVKDHLTILAQINEATNVKVFDALGKSVGIYKIENFSADINSSSYAEGIYLYEIIDKKDEVLSKGKFNVVR
jgi:hypothetical protein